MQFSDHLLIKNHKQECGILNRSSFISQIHSNNLNKFELCSNKVVNTSDYSINWLSLENIDYR
jgi:hypothetical protein